MNELVIVENNEVVVSSRQVAEHFGKMHKNVLASIKEMLRAENSAVLNMFHESTYINAQNKKLPEYLMNRDGFSLLVMGFTGKEAFDWKVKYINAFNKMEEMLKNKDGNLTLPQDYLSALKALVASEEAKQKLLVENTEMKPKADFYDTVVSTESLLSMGDTAKLLDKNVGRNRLYKILREKKILMSDNIPYQQYVDRGYFKVVENYYMAGDNKVITKTTYVKQKGVDYIRKLLEEMKNKQSA